MGRLRNLIRRRRLLAVILLGLFALSAAGGLVLWRRGYLGALRAKLRALHNRLTVTEECVDAPGETKICVVSEMAKLPPGGPVPAESWLFDAAARRIELQAARNEVVAFQVILKGGDTPATANVEVTDLEGPGGAALPATPNITRYLARYVWVDPGGYSWGPPSKVLPWPALYPDALVPFRTACRISSPTGGRAVVSSFTVPHAEGPNQAVWIEIYVPRAQPPGRYRGTVVVTVGEQRAPLSLQLDIHPPVLPDRPTIQAVGELYDPYQVEGVGKQVRQARWQRMAQCYQQEAHRHRTVFIERLDDIEGFEVEGLDESDEAWEGYDRAFGPALNGTLFTRQRGYVGPGEGVPLTVWRTPWVQRYNEVLKAPLTDDEVARYEPLTRTFVGHFQKRGWTAPYLFAYIFDEVVGPADTDSDEAVGRARTAQDPAYVRMVHLQMRRVQQAIDRGAGDRRIDLLWTSHVDPTTWAGKPGLDLAGTIRLWAPNAGAASPDFMRARARAGEQAWFYHAGHPSVGVHAINASGIEMRTWGVITARYGLGGQLMWAVNFGSSEAPYRKPSYKDDDDRFGNGTLVYPGRRLPAIGLPAIDEPVPSMRLKAWRRGLQDAELVALARRAGRGAEADRLLRQLVPRALAEGVGDAAWPTDSAAWHRFRLQLLRLAAPR